MAHSDAPPNAAPAAPHRSNASEPSNASAPSTIISDPSDGPAGGRGGRVGGEGGPNRSAGGSALERIILDDQAIRRALMRIAHEILETTVEPERLYLIAIPNGGVPLGRILVENLESLVDQRVPLGILDTTLYRDDLSVRGSRPRLRRTEMPSSVDDQIVVLVEDVVSTGRTIRAAMDALMDFGRPSQVRVVALVDRGHRELPIKIDYVGKNIPTQPSDKVIFRRGDAQDTEDSSSGEDILGAESGPLELVVRGGGAHDRA